MIIYNKIRQIYSENDCQTQKIIEFFRKIPDENIDNKKSKVFLKKDLIHIELFSKPDRCYPMEILIGINEDKHRIFFFVGHEYVFDYDNFSEENDLLEILYELESIFKSNIEVREYYIGTDLYKNVILCDKFLKEDGSIIDFVDSYKTLWSWKKKKVVIKKKYFKPWIPDNE